MPATGDRVTAVAQRHRADTVVDRGARHRLVVSPRERDAGDRRADLNRVDVVRKADGRRNIKQIIERQLDSREKRIA